MQQFTDVLHSRCKGIVVLGSEVVRVQIEHPHHESHENCDENHHELKDVFHCSSQRDLQRAKALVGWQNVCNARETQHHCNRIEAFRNKLRVWRHPVDSSWKETSKFAVSKLSLSLDHRLCIQLLQLIQLSGHSNNELENKVQQVKSKAALHQWSPVFVLEGSLSITDGFWLSYMFNGQFILSSLCNNNSWEHLINCTVTPHN